MHCTEVKKSTYPPRNVPKSKKGSHNNCTALKSKRVPILPETFANPKKVRTTIALHWSKKEYLSSQKRSQIQKRFAQQLHCTEVKKSTYPPRNVHKSKKGSHNKCMYPLHPGTFVRVCMIIVLYWAWWYEYICIPTQECLQIHKVLVPPCTELKHYLPSNIQSAEYSYVSSQAHTLCSILVHTCI